MKDFKTSTKKVRGLGSARSGTAHFWYQRISGLANIPLLLFFIGFIVGMQGANYQQFVDAVAHPFVAVMLIALMIAVSLHMRLGMQVVIEDYIHHEGMKIILLFFNTVFAFLVGLISVFSILKISFGV
jgi:succinate dehydrogenase / fumarate reductase, membrane anchor subunit